MLPEPGQVGGEIRSGDADDLIAKLADEQIDRLMARDEAGTAEIVSPFEPAASAPAVMEPAVMAPAAVSPAADPVGTMDVEVDGPADAAGPIIAARVDEASSDEAARSDDASAVARELAADDALHNRPAAEPLPPVGAEPAYEATPDVDNHFSTSNESDASPQPTIASFADAYAPTSDAPVTEAPVAARSRAVAVMLSVTQTLLDAINYPVRNASDRAREALGVVAIVTILNAAVLLAYRLFFSPSH